jgi:MarR family transcriptional regulator, transcriptional regulator for hemolysin
VSPIKRLKRPAAYYTDPNNSIGYLARMIFKTYTRLLERKSLQYQITGGQWRILRPLWLQDGVTQRELSDLVGMRESTTVVAINSLEKSGLVRRKSSATDRRKIHIFLTPRAKELKETLFAPFVQVIHEISIKGMTDLEVEILQRLMKQVIANLTEAVPEAPHKPDGDE